MTLEDTLKFKVLAFSPDGVTSPVTDYLDTLLEKDKEAYIKCIDKIIDLSLLIFYKNKSIKHFKLGRHSCFELKVKYKNNEYRFMYVEKDGRVIVFYGFTKKTQKTKKIDLENGIRYFEHYLKNKKTIVVDNR